MGQLMKWFWEAIAGDPPPVLPPSIGPDMVSRREYEKMQTLYAWAIRDMREQRMRAECFEGELLRRGETVRTLAARVDLHKRTLKQKVRAS